MIRKIGVNTTCVGALVVLAALLLFSGEYSDSSPSFLGSCLRFVLAVCLDSGTQWMVMVCLASHYIILLDLERKSPAMASVAASKQYPSLFAALFQRNCYCPSFWLRAFLFLILLGYAFTYTKTYHSLQILVLITGIVVGKALAIWARRQGVTMAPRRVGVVCVFVGMLAISIFCQSDPVSRFQFHNLPRWSGFWDNPNKFGVLMGTGMMLAIGCVVQSLKSKVSSWGMGGGWVVAVGGT